MADNVPSLWDSGCQWGTAATSLANAYWQGSGSPTHTAGKPAVCVAFDAVLYAPMSASWSLGRDNWMDVLKPGNATFTFVLDAYGTLSVGDRVIVSASTPSGDGWTEPLLVGFVDTVSTTTDEAGNEWGTVNCVDQIALLGQAQAPTSVSGGAAIYVIEEILEASGLTFVIDAIADAENVAADASVDDTVLGYINRIERSRNAVVVITTGGHVFVRPRETIASGAITPLALTGVDAPRTLTITASQADVINDWSFTDEAGSWTEEPSTPTSIALYGKHSYSVTDMLFPDADTWEDLTTGGGLGLPRGIITAEFPISSRAQGVLWLESIDYVSWGGNYFTVMSVSHNANPGEWSVTIRADVSIRRLMGLSE